MNVLSILTHCRDSYSCDHPLQTSYLVTEGVASPRYQMRRQNRNDSSYGRGTSSYSPPGFTPVRYPRDEQRYQVHEEQYTPQFPKPGMGPRCTYCQGWHPGGPNKCWLNARNPQNRLSEAALRCYSTGYTPMTRLPPGMGEAGGGNPPIRPFDQLQFVILTQSANAILETHGGKANLHADWSYDNAIVLRAPKEGNEASSKSSDQAAQITTHGTGDPTNASFSNAQPVQNVQDEMAMVEEELRKHKAAIALQIKQQELQELQDQLAAGKSNASTSDKGRTNASTSNKGKQTNAQPQPQPGLDLLLAANDSAHIPANLGNWGRTQRASKWTKPLVNELIGTTPYARMAQWSAYSTFYAEEHVTQELRSAFMEKTVDACLKALKDQKLAVADLQDMRNPIKTGDLTNIEN